MPRTVSAIATGPASTTTPTDTTAGPPLRVAHIDTEHDYAGGEVQVFLLLEGMRRRGHAPVLICQPGSRAAQEAERRGHETIAIPMRNDADFAAIAQIRRALLTGSIDVAHLHTSRANVLAGAAAWWAGVPAVSSRRMQKRVRDSYKNRAVYGRFLDRVIAVSPAVSSCLERGGVPRERIALISEGVDPQRVQPSVTRSEVRDELGAGEGDCVLLTMSALVHRKGIDVLLRAFAELAVDHPHLRLCIAGTGESAADLAAIARPLPCADRVHFLGERNDPANVLGAADVFVMPSRQEGLGVAALEAMAAGLPVVCSAVGGLTHSVVAERTGLLVPPGDVAALRDALQRLVADAALRERLGAQGPKRIAEEFSADDMVDAHIALYRHLAQR